MKPGPVVLSFLLAATLFADQPRQTTPTFLETLEVRVTNVDVVVTDRGGKSVPGLRRADFEILEDGVPQKVTNFAEYGGSTGAAEMVPTPAAPAVTPPPARKFLFYIDEMSLTKSTRNNLADRAGALVRNEMRPGDEAMVVTRATSGHQIVLDFSGDRSLVEQRLRDSIQKQGSFGITTGARLEQYFYQHGARYVSGTHDYKQIARIYAGRVNRRVTSSLRTLLGLVGSLNQTSGKKILVVLTESMPSEPGREAFRGGTAMWQLSPVTDKFTNQVETAATFDSLSLAANASWFDARPMIQELAARASANGVTIYTLQPDLGFEISVPGGADERRGSAARSSVVTPLQRGLLEETRDTLQTLADQTGGKYFLGGRLMGDGFRQIGEDISSYYSLGYRAEGGRNEAVRKIEVRLKNHPELTARTSREIMRKSPEREMDEMVAATLVAPRDINELAVTAVAGTPRRGRGSSSIPVTVKIPLSKLTFVPEGDKYRAAFTVHYAVADAADHTTGTYREQTVDVPASEIDSARGKYFTYTSTLQVSPGTAQVAVGVFDRYSRLSSFQKLEVGAR